MRITRKVFHDLAIWQIGFGLCIGVVFPPFVLLLGVPRSVALTPVFFAACLAAGALAGLVNYLIARRVVGARLRLLAERMTHVEESLKVMTESGDVTGCTPEECAIVIDSDDEIGESAAAFNRLVETLSASMRTQAAVRSFSAMLSSHLDIETLAEEALREFVAHAGVSGGIVAYESQGELKIAASYGLCDPAAIIAGGVVEAAMKRGERRAVVIPPEVRLDGLLADFRPREVWVCPVAHKGVPLGAVLLASTDGFDANQSLLIDLFLQGFGLALNNAIAHDRLQHLAALDPLTGVYNRRFGLGRLREEFGRAVRASAPLGVLMMDIDHFKAVNDTYGHLVGDRVLKSVCANVRSCLREGDVLVRYGGEELLAVMPAASSDDLWQMGERLRRAVEDVCVEDGSRRIRVTLSAGGAAYPGAGVQRDEDLVRLADDGLYKAKEAGRNQVVIAS